MRSTCYGTLQDTGSDAVALAADMLADIADLYTGFGSLLLAGSPHFPPR